MIPLPLAFGAPLLSARIRTTPEDFQVDELPAFEATGEGEHLLLHIRKRGANTVHVAKVLAKWAGLPEMGVSYAGMKDRNAVTTQRFSVHLPKRIAPDLATLASDEIEVLEATWHNRKLQRGALAGNRFKLVLRDVQGNAAAIDERLQQIATRGLPNWFGEQRFGRDGGNVPAALAMFGGRRMRQDQRSLLLSAARSALFNRVLAARVEQGSWDQPLDGEVWMLDGSRSVFGPEPYTDALAERLARFDIHPSAPLWGEGELRSTDAARALVVQTLLGASRMLDEAGESPAELRRRVTSPNGTTQAAIESFQADGFEALVDKALQAAQQRGRQLSAAND